ncbi:MAG TPA: tetratricopeptide repeat protein [Pyrinomonadaceae bacterium]|nr:tetratricopeptide repeat protein [Pyrinomonadaceae bacterium]
MTLPAIKYRTTLWLALILLASSIAHAQGDIRVTDSLGAKRFTQNVPPAALAIYERAVKLRKGGKLQLAISLFQEAIKLFPDYFDARYALALDLARTGNSAEAIVQLEEARKINPSDDRLYQSFGAILIEQKKYTLAAASFAEAARLNPNNPRYPLMRGIAILYYVSEIDAARVQSPQDRSYLLGRAEEALNRAYQLSDRKLAIVHFYLGMLYEKKGEPLRAAAELEQYLAANPQDTNAAVIRETIEKLRRATAP